MAAREHKVFLLELELKTQGKVIGGHTTVKHGPLDFSKGMMAHQFHYQVKSQYDLGSGALTGRRNHEAITIVREVDEASPLLWSALCSNEGFKTATLSFARPSNQDGKLVLYCTIALTQGALVRYETYHGGKFSGNSDTEQTHSNEIEEFDLVFNQIVYTNALKSKSGQDSWSSQT
jgi:type VI secretion system secreted protein Hcp